MGRQLARRAAAIALALAVVEVLLRGVFAYPPVAGRLATNDDLSYRRAWVERQRGATGSISDAENREREELFRRICREAEGAACMSVSEPLLAASAGPACCQVPGGHHWNARAHLLAAQSMLASLRRAGLAPGC